MSIDYTQPSPTQITIRPEPQAAVHQWRKSIQKVTLGDDDFSKQLSASQGIPSQGAGSQTASSDGVSFWGKDGFGFDDVIDLINPLQHIPIISSIYRAITGDEIAAGPRMVGGGVIGGVIGAVVSAADVMFEQETGKDIGENVMAMVRGEEPATQQASAASIKQVARTQPRPQAVASLSPTPLEPLAFDAPMVVPAAFSSADVVQAQPKPPAGAGAEASDPAAMMLELFNANRTQAQQNYAKSQGLMTSQAVARDLKL